MKKMNSKIVPLLITVFIALSLSGCDFDDWIVDWAPVNIYIEAVDSDDNSIISPQMPGMTLTFRGETYTVIDMDSVARRHATKTYLAVMEGLVAQPSMEIDGKTVYRLVFGEIDGAADMDEDIVLSWPDGSRDVIHYHCSDHKEGRNPKCKRSWKLNGKEHEGNTFRFQKTTGQ